ncbi:IS21-like element helper ATPase IstB [Leucobacter sp. OH1287]|uniref:IS21-like element helper ATPase IstB n=1 Tax=Leucobacter sp. OH1287 TaxID=2491049 RepID=UPI001F1A7E93|nr:IS21-like element helper ATPase IstB [Leucobacter sp. OH1287]
MPRGTILPTPSISDIMDKAATLTFTKQVICEVVEDANASQRRFLYRLLEEEEKSRRLSRQQRLIKQAKFPAVKTLDGFDYSTINWPVDWGRAEMESLAFIAHHEDLVLYGDVGTGKTHLATALGFLACQNGLAVRYYTAASLIGVLHQACEEGRLDKVLTMIAKADLLIIDELGYIPIDTEGARLIYQVIANAYEKQSVIYTSNLEFSRWASVFGDANMAAAIIDRTVHHGRILRFEGTSYRVLHATMK